MRRHGGHVGGHGDGDRNNGRDGGGAEPLDNVHSHRGEAQFFPRDGGVSRGYRRDARGTLSHSANEEADKRGCHRETAESHPKKRNGPQKVQKHPAGSNGAAAKPVRQISGARIHAQHAHPHGPKNPAGLRRRKAAARDQKERDEKLPAVHDPDREKLGRGPD